MRSRFVIALLAWSFSIGVARAQAEFDSSPGVPVVQAVLGEPVVRPEVEIVWEVADRDFDRFWFRADYLLWWVKKGPLAAPLVTLGSDADAPFQGILGQQGTRLAYGGAGLDFGATSGFTLTGGLALSTDGSLSLEASWLQMEKRSLYFNAASNAAGYPVIARPIINAATGLENSELESSPLVGIAGGIRVASSSQLQGWEINFSANSPRSAGWNVSGQLGFRALILTETIELRDSFQDITGFPGGAGLTFLGAPVLTSSPLTGLDSFHAVNHFYGPQIGGQAEWNDGVWSLKVVGKLAMGCNQELVIIDGATTAVINPGDARTSAPGGVLTQTSNINRYFRNAFAVVPEVGLNLGVQLTDRIKFQLGYHFLYWSSVVRPGDVIDRTVNRFAVPSDQNFGLGTGPARPAFTFHATDYWAQGLNFGLEFRY